LSEHQSQHFFIPGATTVGLVCSEGVILASEKRITYGGLLLSRGGKKVFKVTERIGIACAGLVSDMQVLTREIVAYTKLFNLESKRSISVKAVAKITSNILFNSRFAPLINQTIVGGIDEDGPSLYVMDMLGSSIPDKFATVGSGSAVAIGVLEENYKDDITLEEGKNLVVKAIKAGISRDAKSGDGIDLLILTKNGINEESINLK
jgi:proteasome beta subunit